MPRFVRVKNCFFVIIFCNINFRIKKNGLLLVCLLFIATYYCNPTLYFNWETKHYYLRCNM